MTPPVRPAETACAPAAFAKVTRNSVSGTVYRALRDAILSGQWEAGSALPGERTLADQFGVNRHALREAMRRLEQARLVDVAQGGATRIRDWHENAGLELLADIATSGELPPAHVLRSVLEMRVAVGVDAARLAAMRITPTDAKRLKRHVTASADADPTDLAALSARYDALWRLIVRASDNLAYQLADNSLVIALQHIGEIAIRLGEKEIRDIPAQRRLVDTITAHDEDAAVEAAHALVSRMLTTR